MASMNNWLGFSLSPQEHNNNNNEQHQQQQLSHDVSGECFDLSSDSSTLIPSLNLPPSFGILEAFNTNNQSQDWNVKDVNNVSSDHHHQHQSNYRTSSSSEMCMLMESSSNNNNGNQQGLKLENFLGVGVHHNHHHQHHHYTNNQEQTTIDASTAVGLSNNNSTIGLSMIKNWLRNNPTSSNPENKNDNSDGVRVHVNGNGNIPTSGAAQTLSLSMSTGSQSSSAIANAALPLLNGGESSVAIENTNKEKNGTTSSLDSQTGAIEAAVPRKSIDTFGQRTSIYRGVTRHRWTGRYEAHLWDNSCRREGQTRKGRQVYLGGYDKEEKAARAYDLAALKYWGTSTTTNFPISDYEKETEEMKHMTRQEFIASLRRKSSGFSRGASIYRGVTRHHQHGRWQARIGRVAGNKDLYLGTFSTQEEAAEAYDIAAIKFRGLNAVTNFEMSRYDVKTILESSTLPIGSTAKRLKDAEQAEIMSLEAQRNHDANIMSSHHLLDHGMSSYNTTSHHHPWSTIAFQQAQPAPLSTRYAYGGQPRLWCKQETDHGDVTNSFQDFHQLQFGNPHNFVQPSVLHNLMNLDSSTMEHSSGSNSIIYNSGGGDGNGGNCNNGTFNGTVYGNSSGGYMLPMATVVAAEGNQNQENGYGDMFGSTTDSYQARNFYYQQHSQQSSNGGATEKSSVYDQSSSCNTWVPTAVPTNLDQARTADNNMAALCHGAQTFTVWNDHT